MSERIRVGGPPRVLLVEDNDDDAYLIAEAFALAPFGVAVERVHNGVECMGYLRREAPYAQAATPHIVILDLSMPLMDGREVMAEIGRDPQLAYLPVVVLTTSAAEDDILSLYRLRCNSYVVKPVGFDSLCDKIGRLAEYWFDLVELPASQS
jgi:two-component system response regulator